MIPDQASGHLPPPHFSVPGLDLPGFCEERLARLTRDYRTPDISGDDVLACLRDCHASRHISSDLMALATAFIRQAEAAMGRPLSRLHLRW